MLSHKTFKLRLQTRARHVLPDYVRNKTPLLMAPRPAPIPVTDAACCAEERRAARASLITGAVVGLPLLYMGWFIGDAGEFLNVLAILPMLPVLFVAFVVMPTAWSLIVMAWPVAVVAGAALFVFIAVY